MVSRSVEKNGTLCSVSKLHVGIIGCAAIAEKYAIRAFQALPEVGAISIASRDLSKAKEWAGRFGIQAEESYESLIKNPDIHAIYIPLPIGLHKEWAIQAAETKKHIILEKSLAGDLGSVTEILEACRKNNVVLYENFMCDFHPQHAAVAALIKEGNIGAPFLFEGWFGFPKMNENNFRYDKTLGGGSLNDAGAYTIFMARKLFQKEPLSVSAVLHIDQEKGVDMGGSALLQFPENQVATVTFSFDSLYQNTYSIWGRKGLIRVQRAYAIPPDMKPKIEWVTNVDMKEVVTALEAPAANHFEGIFKDFLTTVLNHKNEAEKIEYTYTAILNQARTLEAVRLSAKENRKVFLSELV